jgi:dTDP-L-rhamnose 4-epimerase
VEIGMAATYLVTGGAGFIGRRICRELLEQGHRIRVLGSLIPQVHAGQGLDILPEVELVEGDVRNSSVVARAIKGVDGIFHLAAEVGVGQSMYEIARYVSGNDLGTAVLLEQVAANPVGRLVVASSMSVYGEGLYKDEDGMRHGSVRRAVNAAGAGWDPEGPKGQSLRPVPTDEAKQPDLASIYALTKYAQEQSCLIIGRAYGIDVVALRLFNVFGPGQALSNPYTGVLANFGSRLLNRQPPLIFEDGLQKRDFVHVGDVARAFRLAMESRSAAGHVINIGSGRAYAILDVARLLAGSMGVAEIDPALLGKARAGDIRHCFADIAKARDLLGFAPTIMLEDGVDELAAWIRSSKALDRGEDAKRQLEARGLVA